MQQCSWRGHLIDGQIPLSGHLLPIRIMGSRRSSHGCSPGHIEGSRVGPTWALQEIPLGMDLIG
jgi:hypothetical protein